MNNASLPTQPASRLRLHYLDGIRALAALVVVFSHLSDGNFYQDAGQNPPYLFGVIFPALAPFGRYAVALFIVLSGYSLTLPVARNAAEQLEGGVRGYLLRRSRRMLPPYYAAILLCLCSLFVLSRLPSPTPEVAKLASRAFAPDVLLSHLFLVHNLSVRWCFEIEGPLWTIATEWQIYFFFALLLLPLKRKFGFGVVLGVAFILGLTPHFLLKRWLDPVAPWYLGLFALGMLCAYITHAEGAQWQAWRAKMFWGVWAGAGTVLLLIGLALKPARLPSYPLYLLEPLIGLVFLCFLVWLAQHKDSGNEASPLALRVVEHPLVVGIGRFSYSLYLVHTPLIWWLITGVRGLPFSTAGRVTILWVGGIPLILAGSYLFYLVAEKPFLSSRARQSREPHEPPA